MDFYADNKDKQLNFQMTNKHLTYILCVALILLEIADFQGKWDLLGCQFRYPANNYVQIV